MKRLYGFIFFVAFFDFLIYSQGSIYFTDINTGYFVNGSNTIYKTSDGGIDWIEQTTGTSNGLYSVFFTDANTGCVVGDNVIYNTIDGGDNWIKNSYSSGYESPWVLRSVFFPTPDTGYIVGFLYTILKTSDAGNNWTLLDEPGTNATYRAVYFANSNIGYIAGGLEVYKTVNGGDNWNKLYTNSSKSVESFYFINADTGYAACTGGEILKTINGGNNWIIQSIGINQNLNSIYFTDANTGYAVGSNGTIFKTTNGGDNWIAQISNTEEYLADVFFIDDLTGYIRSSSSLLKTIDGGNNWIKLTMPTTLISNFISETTSLCIYPNPCDGNFTLEFDNPNNNLLLIEIINIEGKTLIKTSSTKDKCEIYEKDLFPGIYLVKVIGEHLIYGKLIVR